MNALSTKSPYHMGLSSCGIYFLVSQNIKKKKLNYFPYSRGHAVTPK